MILYFALLFPILGIFVLLFLFKNKTATWEYFLPFVICLICIVISKVTIENYQLESKEYWGSEIVSTQYYEDWNEYIHQTCTSTCCCDDKGNNCTTTTYDCSYVDYHPPYWDIKTTSNEILSIDKTTYQYLVNRFGNQNFKELNRNYYTNDGNEYFSVWNNDSATSVPVSTLHYYENRIKASDQSTFHFQKVSDEDIKQYQLIQYPDIKNKFDFPVILGNRVSKEDQKLMQYVNGHLGPKKEVRVWILLYENKPKMAGQMQEWLWSGGNMNEMVLTIGIDSVSRKIQWSHVFSWTTNERVKIEIRNYLADSSTMERLNIKSLSYFLKTELKDKFVRRNFKEFDYLTVEPSVAAIIIVYVITLVVTVLSIIWIIMNEFN